MRWIVALLLGAVVNVAQAFACQPFFAPVLNKTTPSWGVITVEAVNVAVYISGTTNLAVIYSDANCTSTKTNPTTTDADGLFSFWANDGYFDVAFSKSGFTFPAAVTALSLFEPLGEHVYLNAKFASTDPCATTTGAIDQIGTSNQRTLVINKPVACGLTKTATSNIEWVFTGSGSILLASPSVLTINGPVKCPHGRTCFQGNGTYVFGAAAGPYPYGQMGIVTPTYGANVTIDCSLGKTFVVNVTNNSNFTLTNATKCGIGGRHRIRIKNTSGGALGTLTFGSASFYKTGAAWTQPANGFHRDIEFEYDGTNMVEITRSAADVAN